MMPVVGICGRMNSGKGVVANILRQEFNFVPMALADPIKSITKRVFDVPDEELWGSGDKRSTRTRQMLQRLGTEWGRYFDSEIWIKHLTERVLIWKTKGVDTWNLIQSELPLDNRISQGIVVPDVRFENEVIALKNKLDACIIKVKRPKIRRDKQEDLHPSEVSVDVLNDDLLDLLVCNDNSQSHLEQTIREFFTKKHVTTYSK